MSATDAPTPVIIDTDCGVDDAVALWWALTDPRLEVVGITSVWGNTGAESAAGNVLRILEATGRTGVPVAVGATGPVGPGPELRRADFIHGRDGLGDTFRPAPALSPVEEPAQSLLRRLVDERPEEITVVTIGPLTNVARVLEADPSWATRVADLVVMGGVVSPPGNALPVCEANIAHDPEAAARVVAAAWSRPPMLVGLDVTRRATLTQAEFDLLAKRRNDAAGFLDEPLRYYRRFGGTFTPGECPCHDLLAVMATVESDLLEAPVLPLAIQTEPGPAWGQTVVDQRGPFFAAATAAAGGETAEQPSPEPSFRPWRVALEVDVARFRRLVRRLFGDDS
jgi:purine nucleosidase